MRRYWRIWAGGHLRKIPLAATYGHAATASRAMSLLQQAQPRRFFEVREVTPDDFPSYGIGDKVGR